MDSLKEGTFHPLWETQRKQVFHEEIARHTSGFLAWNICQTAKKEWDIFGTVFSHPTKELKALRDII